jgi:hypothetical protein
MLLWICGFSVCGGDGRGYGAGEGSKGYREMIEGKLTASTDCLGLRMALRMCHLFTAEKE